MEKMMSTTTLTCIDISDIYNGLELTNDEVEWIADKGFSNISFGDATFTLIPSRFTLECLLDGYEDYHSCVIANKSMTRDDFVKKYWEIVWAADAEYVNLEF
jgi:hypothetical protein